MLTPNMTVKFDYTKVDGNLTTGRIIVIESVKPYMHTNLIVGKLPTLDANGREQFRSFHEDKMFNIETM